MFTAFTTPAATPVRAAPPAPLQLSLATTTADIEDAQRLRWQVFADELGADLPGSELDLDEFDPWCDHLIVRDSAQGLVVGTYRILPPHRARALGRCYADGEFDLAALAPLRPQMVELGRSCVHPAYRGGAVINLLWAGLARYMRAGGHGYLVGCPSIGMGDGGRNAAAIYHALAASHLSPPEYRVTPRCPLPLEAFAPTAAEQALPPLIKGYIRLGAWICGEPAWDPAFHTADLLMLMPMARIAPRHLQRLLAGA
jgi:putative hemolysin